jgi:hypothetical protein
MVGVRDPQRLNMNATKIPLSMVKVASPCTASWDAMSGTDQARFCGECAEYVYNFSEMTSDGIAALIREKEGKVCVRYFLRSDGTIMTADCPVGARAVRRLARLRVFAVAVFAAVVSLLTVGAVETSRDSSEPSGQAFNPIKRVKDWLFPPPEPPRRFMGKI